MNKHEFRAKDYLLHMLEAADRVLEYTSGVSEEHFFANQMLQDAVVRNIEIIGEAANNLLEVGPDLRHVKHFPPMNLSIRVLNQYSGTHKESMSQVSESHHCKIPYLI